MLLKVITWMDRHRFRSAVVSLTTPGKMGERIRALGIPVYSLGMRNWFLGPVALLRLTRVLRVLKPDVLQTWLFHADLLGLLAARATGVRALVWNVRCAELDPADYGLAFAVMLKILARVSALPAAVIVNSVAGKSASIGLGYRPRRWALIPNGFDLDLFHPSHEARLVVRQELGLPLGATLIGLIARFDRMKDHESFLAAASKVHDVRSDVQFVLVGDRVDTKNAVLMEAVSSLHIEHCVHLLGERTDIPIITAALDVATCTSYTEGFPNVLGEAMACGVPCVATAVGDCPSIVGDTGILVPSKNPRALAEAWLKILGMPSEERQRLGLRARERIAKLFDIRTIVSRYQDLYQEVLTA